MSLSFIYPQFLVGIHLSTSAYGIHGFVYAHRCCLAYEQFLVGITVRCCLVGWDVTRFSFFGHNPLLHLPNGEIGAWFWASGWRCSKQQRESRFGSVGNFFVFLGGFCNVVYIFLYILVHLGPKKQKGKEILYAEDPCHGLDAVSFLMCQMNY